MDGRLARAKAELSEIKVKKEYAMGIWLPGSISKRDTLLNTPSDTLLLGQNKKAALPRSQYSSKGPNSAHRKQWNRKKFFD